MLRFRAAVCSSGGPVTGVVGEDILVLPNMSPRYALDFAAAKGAIAEVGGALAHLAIVAREEGKTMMVLPNACTLLPAGSLVTLNPSRCEILCTLPNGL